LIRKGCSGGINHGRIAAEASRQLEPSGVFFLSLKVPCADFVQVPMHAGSAPVENLHAIKADVFCPLGGILGKNHRQRDKRPRVAGPAREHGKKVQVRVPLNDLAAREICP